MKRIILMVVTCLLYTSYIDGCIAGGRQYAHINPAGDVEPCVFIHYSNANIHEKSLLELSLIHI